MSEIAVGQIGAGFIGKVHSLAYRGAAAANRELPVPPRLAAIADRDEALAAEAARAYGWERTVTDWRRLLSEPAVQLLDVATPNDLHLEPILAAAAAGVDVLCEKPLAPVASEALEAWRAAEAARIRHLCAFMYRFIPAVRHLRELIRAGELGEVLHFRSQFLLSFAVDPTIPSSWRFERAAAGAGALGDLGSHHIDLARFLVGEVESVSGSAGTFVAERPGGAVTNDDFFAAIASLEGGATAVLEGSRVAGNHGLTSRVEIDGTRGSVRFEFERLNELSLSRRGEHGFRTYLVTQAEHPYSDFWLPCGIQGQHPISWADCFAHQAHAMLAAIGAGRELEPEAPTFRDGYRVAAVVEAVETAAREGARVPVEYEAV